MHDLTWFVSFLYFRHASLYSFIIWTIIYVLGLALINHAHLSAKLYSPYLQQVYLFNIKENNMSGKLLINLRQSDTSIAQETISHFTFGFWFKTS
jgi:hypothetical protein